MQPLNNKTLLLLYQIALYYILITACERYREGPWTHHNTFWLSISEQRRVLHLTVDQFVFHSVSALRDCDASKQYQNIKTLNLWSH